MCLARYCQGRCTVVTKEIPSSQQGCNWQSVECGCEGSAPLSDFKLLERNWINEVGFAGSVLISAHKF